MPIMLWGGKILVRNGKIATSSDCCCSKCHPASKLYLKIDYCGHSWTEELNTVPVPSGAHGAIFAGYKIWDTRCPIQFITDCPGADVLWPPAWPNVCPFGIGPGQTREGNTIDKFRLVCMMDELNTYNMWMCPGMTDCNCDEDDGPDWYHIGTAWPTTEPDSFTQSPFQLTWINKLSGANWCCDDPFCNDSINLTVTDTPP